MGDGDGVRANGDNGICPTDFLRFGELGALFFTCNLYLRPCSDDGLADGDVVPLAPGEQGTESTGLDEQESEGGESDDPVLSPVPTAG